MSKDDFKLELTNGIFDIVDPLGNVYNVKVEFSGSRLMYSSLIGDTLYTGETPLELLETVAENHIVMSDDYQNGFYDGVASVKHTDDRYEEGYNKAIDEVTSYLISKQYSPEVNSVNSRIDNVIHHCKQVQAETRPIFNDSLKARKSLAHHILHLLEDE